MPSATAVAPASHTQGQTFWWDRAHCAHADAPPLKAVIFDVDRALSEALIEDTLTPPAGLLDLVDSLRCAGIGIAVATAGRRTRVEPLVRQIFGDGVIEVMVTGDDIVEQKPDPEVYLYTLHELGLKPESVLAILDSSVDLRVAVAAEVAAIVVTTGATRGRKFAGATAVLPGWTGAPSLDAERCRRMHDRWWVRRHR